MNTPQRSVADMRHVGLKENGNANATSAKKKTAPPSAPIPKKKAVMEYESDIEADDLLPVYLETKTKLFHLLPARGLVDREAKGRKGKQNGPPLDPEAMKLMNKITRIENDILFDKYVAEQEWQKKKIILEKEAAAARAANGGAAERVPHPAEDSDSEDDIMVQAAKMSKLMLESDSDDSDDGVADLFAQLPVTEVDANGNSIQVLNNPDGTKVAIREFAKSAGIQPRRVDRKSTRLNSSHWE